MFIRYGSDKGMLQYVQNGLITFCMEQSEKKHLVKLSNLEAWSFPIS